MKNYHINIFYSDDDGGFIADIPDLKNCSAFGANPNEALKQVLIAQKLWLDEAESGGLPIPLPMYRPIIYKAI
ncbi:MAG: type II toxin-antitoxin system HicB family antitoxin [Oscillospiraceae bacterium]|nr:type II toxin-antitoxin system HicB family antitoxin [Oscillospiraceae bacterium]